MRAKITVTIKEMSAGPSWDDCKTCVDTWTGSTQFCLIAGAASTVAVFGLIVSAEAARIAHEDSLLVAQTDAHSSGLGLLQGGIAGFDTAVSTGGEQIIAEESQNASFVAFTRVCPVAMAIAGLLQCRKPAKYNVAMDGAAALLTLIATMAVMNNIRFVCTHKNPPVRRSTISGFSNKWSLLGMDLGTERPFAIVLIQTITLGIVVGMFCASMLNALSGLHGRYTGSHMQHVLEAAKYRLRSKLASAASGLSDRVSSAAENIRMRARIHRDALREGWREGKAKYKSEIAKERDRWGNLKDGRARDMFGNLVDAAQVEQATRSRANRLEYAPGETDMTLPG